MKTTFRKLKVNAPNDDSVFKLINYYTPENLDDEITLLQILESNGITDTLWYLRAFNIHNNYFYFLAGIIESTLPLFVEEALESEQSWYIMQSIKKYAENKTGLEAIIALGNDNAAITANIYLKKLNNTNRCYMEAAVAAAAYAADAAYAAAMDDSVSFANLAYAAACFAVNAKTEKYLCKLFDEAELSINGVYANIDPNSNTTEAFDKAHKEVAVIREETYHKVSDKYAQELRNEAWGVISKLVQKYFNYD